MSLNASVIKGQCPACLIHEEKVARLEGEVAAKAAALEVAQAHCEELREAWERGVLDEHDGQGGTRSNRNVEVLLTIRAALSDTGKGWVSPEVAKRVREALKQAECELLGIEPVMPHRTIALVHAARAALEVT